MPVKQETVGCQIARLRAAAGLTQAELGTRLGVTYQAVSKWERGETLPDTALLPDLAQVLGTTVDDLLCGGERMGSFRQALRVQDMMDGVACLARMGELLGRRNILYRGAVDGLSERINSDVEEMLADDRLRECLAAEAIIHNLRLGYYFDLSDIRRRFAHEQWVKVLEEYAARYGIQ